MWPERLNMSRGHRAEIGIVVHRRRGSGRTVHRRADHQEPDPIPFRHDLVVFIFRKMIRMSDLPLADILSENTGNIAKPLTTRALAFQAEAMSGDHANIQLPGARGCFRSC